MSLFEPELVLHAIDHDRADEEGRFCWCVSQERIDAYFDHMWDLIHNEPEDVRYGRHSLYSVQRRNRGNWGWAFRILGKALVPIGDGDYMRNENYVGEHRMHDWWSEALYVFYAPNVVARATRAGDAISSRPG